MRSVYISSPPCFMYVKSVYIDELAARVRARCDGPGVPDSAGSVHPLRERGKLFTCPDCFKQTCGDCLDFGAECMPSLCSHCQRDTGELEPVECGQCEGLVCPDCAGDWCPERKAIANDEGELDEEGE